MSKHVSLQSQQPRSVVFFYCVEGQPVFWGGPYVLRLEKLTIFQLIELVDGAFFDEDVALSHLQYLLRLDNILKLMDTKRLVPGTRSAADYLGSRPRTCCSETSKGGLARGKSNAS